MVTKTSKNIIDDLVEVFALTDTETSAGTALDTYELTGLGENTNARTQEIHILMVMDLMMIKQFQLPIGLMKKNHQ